MSIINENRVDEIKRDYKIISNFQIKEELLIIIAEELIQLNKLLGKKYTPLVKPSFNFRGGEK